MVPELTFQLMDGPITILSYPLFMSMGLVLGLWFSATMLKHYAIKNRVSLLMMLVPAFILGARLWNVAVEPRAFQGEFHWYDFGFQGFSLYGGLFVAILVVLLFGRLTQQDTWLLLDAFVIPAVIALIFARMGCFMEGCCVGKTTGSSFGVVFPRSTIMKEALGNFSPIFKSMTVKQHPTQLYELGLASFLLLPFLSPLIGRKWRSGLVFLSYGILFTAMRLFMLTVRELPYEPYVVEVLYPVLYRSFILMGLVAILWRRKRKL